MVVDSSVLVAILLAEHDAPVYARAIEGAERRLISTVSMLEVSIVMARRKGQNGLDSLRDAVADAGIEAVAFTEAHRRAAQSAYERFGKGRHPARLNLGDCCAYALAKTLDQPLLFKGRDFARTDIAAVPLAAS